MGNGMIRYRSGYKHILNETYTVITPIRPASVTQVDDWVILEPSGRLTIKKGYAWDGASGAFDTKTIMRGSLVHDALYQLMREEKLPLYWIDQVNELLHTICIEDGMNWLRAWYVLRAVKMFGTTFASPREPVINTAP